MWTVVWSGQRPIFANVGLKAIPAISILVRCRTEAEVKFGRISNFGICRVGAQLAFSARMQWLFPQQSNNLAHYPQYLSAFSVAPGTQFVPGLCL